MIENRKKLYAEQVKDKLIRLPNDVLRDQEHSLINSLQTQITDNCNLRQLCRKQQENNIDEQAKSNYQAKASDINDAFIPIIDQGLHPIFHYRIK